MTDTSTQFHTGTHVIGTNVSGVSLEHSQAQHPDLSNLSSAQPYENLQYLFGVQDPAMLAPKPSRNRRKSAQGSEHVKHRRTRSGCYTCRGRRVKCDEKHPICERCRKGNRECKYPEPTTSAKGKISAVKGDVSSTQQSPGSSSDEYDDDEDDAGMMDEDDLLEGVKKPRNFAAPGIRRKNTDQSLRQQKLVSSTRRSSETPSLDVGPSPSPSTEGSVSYAGNIGLGSSKLRTSSLSFDNLRESWTYLPEDLQYYLHWFYENITCQHYSLKHDPGNFLKTVFLEQALENEALLNGIVGFTAFQHSLRNPNSKMLFLQYYNKAVSLLLRSLKKGDHRHSIGTLLTILQLATIEEYLGDWINLLGHQKAAFEILTYLYTPETVMQTEIGRCALKWYSRFDVFGSLMGGFETVLSREWFSTMQLYLESKVQEHPDNLDWKIEVANWKLKLIGMDMSVLFTTIGKGAITMEEFMIKNQGLSQDISGWKENIDPTLQDPRYVVTDFNNVNAQRPLDPQDIVNPYRPGIMYGGPLWPINVSTIDWYALDLMHRYQTMLISGVAGENHALALRAFCVCELFEAVEYWPGSPKGSVVACQASLGIAALFLPKDTRHRMWVRRKLATIETHGYIYPLTFRKKMSEFFQDPSCMDWWLPNSENYTPIVRAIRSFVESRTTQAVDVPQATEDLSNMKAIFSNMKLDDSGSGVNSLPSPADSSGREAEDVRMGKVKEEWDVGGGGIPGHGRLEDGGLGPGPVDMGMGMSMGMPLGEMHGANSWADAVGDLEYPSVNGYWTPGQEGHQNPQY